MRDVRRVEGTAMTIEDLPQKHWQSLVRWQSLWHINEEVIDRDVPMMWHNSHDSQKLLHVILATPVRVANVHTNCY